MIMLSYMVPVEEKPPPVPGKGRLALEFLHAPGSPEAPPRRKTNMSKDSSSSSFASDLTVSSTTPTTHDKPKHKLLGNGTKHTALKRVSFGSSKGSMVETMVYDNFVPEEPEDSLSPASMEIQQAGPLPVIPQNPMQRPPTDEIDTEKVRVSYFTGPIAHCAPPICSPQHHPYQGFPTGGMMGPATKPYSRQASVESGWDNPFRPDGDLSREADEIVSLIKGGKPITPTPPVAQPQLCLDEVDETPSVLHVNDRQTSASKAASPQKSLNGTKNGAAQIEVQKSPEPQQPEHVTIKKKPKCECCVLQ